MYEDKEKNKQARIAAIFRIITAHDRAMATFDFEGKRDVLMYMDPSAKLMRAAVTECSKADAERLDKLFISKMGILLELFHYYEKMAANPGTDKSAEFEAAYDALMEVLIIFSLTIRDMKFSDSSYDAWKSKIAAFNAKLIALAREEFGPQS